MHGQGEVIDLRTGMNAQHEVEETYEHKLELGIRFVVAMLEIALAKTQGADSNGILCRQRRKNM